MVFALFRKGPLARVCCGKYETLAVLYIFVGLLLLALSIFVTRWRVDPSGTEPIEDSYVFQGFSYRTYGLFQVRGRTTQAWGKLRSQACDFMRYALVSSVTDALSRVVSGTFDGCEDDVACNMAFTTHMKARCDAYRTMEQTSYIVLTLTLLSIVLAIGSLMIYMISRQLRTGGITFALFLISGILAVSVNMAWAVVTDRLFKELTETAWYPYPSLGVGYYLHLYGGWMIVISDIMFGIVVIPKVCKYDPSRAKFDKQQEMRKANQLSRIGGAIPPGHLPAAHCSQNTTSHQWGVQCEPGWSMQPDNKGWGMQTNCQGFGAKTEFGAQPDFGISESKGWEVQPGLQRYSQGFGVQRNSPGLSPPPNSQGFGGQRSSQRFSAQRQSHGFGAQPICQELGAKPNCQGFDTQHDCEGWGGQPISGGWSAQPDSQQRDSTRWVAQPDHQQPDSQQPDSMGWGAQPDSQKPYSSGWVAQPDSQQPDSSGWGAQPDSSGWGGQPDSTGRSMQPDSYGWGTQADTQGWGASDQTAFAMPPTARDSFARQGSFSTLRT